MAAIDMGTRHSLEIAVIAQSKRSLLPAFFPPCLCNVADGRFGFVCSGESGRSDSCGRKSFDEISASALHIFLFINICLEQQNYKFIIITQKKSVILHHHRFHAAF
jgi:hypothetical protein